MDQAVNKLLKGLLLTAIDINIAIVDILPDVLGFIFMAQALKIFVVHLEDNKLNILSYMTLVLVPLALVMDIIPLRESFHLFNRYYTLATLILEGLIVLYVFDALIREDSAISPKAGTARAFILVQLVTGLLVGLNFRLGYDLYLNLGIGMAFVNIVVTVMLMIGLKEMRDYYKTRDLIA